MNTSPTHPLPNQLSRRRGGRRAAEYAEMVTTALEEAIASELLDALD